MAIAAVTAAMALSSCDVHEFPDPPTPPPGDIGRIAIRVHVDDGEMPLHTTVYYDEESRTRGARADMAWDLRYQVNVYKASDTPDSRVSTRTPLVSTVITAEAYDFREQFVYLDLPKGDYRVVVWADNVERNSTSDWFYNTSNFTEIVFPQQEGGRVEGNTDYRDAFRGEDYFTVTSEQVRSTSLERPGSEIDVVADVPLHRPMAKFRFVTTDLAEFLDKNGIPSHAPGESAPELNDYTVLVRYTGYMPCAYNVFTDKPVDSRLGQWFDARIRRIDLSDAELGYDYVFVNGSETSVQVALDVYLRRTGEKISGTTPINCPIVRGKITEIRGRFLTTFAEGGVGIDPGFDGEYNVEVFD